MKFNTKFSIKDKVYILPLKVQGKILSIYLSESGLQYSTRYFHDFKGNDCYFYEDELSLDEPKQEIGFNPKI